MIVLVLVALAMAHRGYDPADPRPALTTPPPVFMGDKPDFRAIPDPDTRKQRFFDYLAPAAARVNAEVR